MTPQEFIAKWSRSPRNEHQDAQPHFIDLCRLLNVEDPAQADPRHEWFTFERGASKTTGGSGWADVWRKGHFGWEYKSHGGDLNRAYSQLLNYSGALESPPLLIVSDMEVIRIHTNWTNTVQKVYTLRLPDLADAANRDLLRHCFLDPERLKPAKTRQKLTEEAAEKFASLAQRLRGRGHDPHRVAHFVNRLVFCMFAEDVGLLPDKMFERMIKLSRSKPETFAQQAAKLFAAMKSGGDVGFEPVEWFNGGLFDSDDALPLNWQDIDDLIRASQLDWSEIDPSIFGTLFERGLDPDKRSQLGAHYTDREKIMMIVTPVIEQPLLAEWAAVKAQIQSLAEAAPKQTADKLLRGPDLAARTRAMKDAQALHQSFLDRLRDFRVLDPACGSGNFLYLSLLALKDIEHRVNIEAESLGLPRPLLLGVGPENLLGIELNPYAAELARVSVWIGEVQWMRRNGYEAARNPILRTLDTIECRDAVLAPDGTRADWPKADVVVGNPPFLGGSRILGELGEVYVESLRSAWSQYVPGFADLVCYWFAKAWLQISNGKLARAGFVSTNSIRGGVNREVLKQIVDNGRILAAWSDEEWTVDGAAVRVSLICFEKAQKGKAKLNGEEVARIFANLSVSIRGIDLTEAVQLSENFGKAYLGTKKGGPFDISPVIARDMLLAPLNPNGKPNSNVIHRRFTGTDLARRPDDRWVIDFGHSQSESEAMLYEKPFQHVILFVKPIRDRNRRDARRLNYWLHSETAPGLRKAIASKTRYIGTPRVSKFRLFSWLNPNDSLDDGAIAIARDDDTTFGILHSRFHELWSLRMGTSLEDRPRYTPSTTFETFPFPQGLTPNIPAADYADDPRAQAIAAAAARLNQLRENWLNPPDLVRRVPEVVPGYPDRLLPVSDAAAKVLKTRTLTNLYNARPAWLAHAHAALDQAVADAYGWGEDWRAGPLPDDEILARLFRLNQKRAGGEILKKD